MMPSLKPETWECRVARPSEWSQALKCWFGQSVHSDQLQSLYYQLEHESGLADGLWIAQREGGVDAVAWIIPGTEEYVHCWPLRCNVEQSHEVRQRAAQHVWDAVVAEHKSRGARFFQVNVPIQCPTDRKLLEAIGFKEIGRIKRLRVDLDQPVNEVQTRLVHLEQHDSDDHAAFNELLIECMADSLDVPELNHIQSGNNVAAQYYKPGVERFIIRHPRRGNIGVMALHHDGEMGLIRYLGLIPSSRHRGWGSSALRKAIEYLRHHGCDVIDLRVDARNKPALALYTGAGFQVIDEESMLIYLP
ncbi:MAG: GNAT family N-acetyltransferase [Gemmatales bacterium]